MHASTLASAMHCSPPHTRPCAGGCMPPPPPHTHTHTRTHDHTQVSVWSVHVTNYVIAQHASRTALSVPLQTGTPFCPLLPVLGSISMSLIFLAYYRIVMDTCNPPEKRWTQSRHDPVFIFMLALSSLVVMAPASLYLTGYVGCESYHSYHSFPCI